MKKLLVVTPNFRSFIKEQIIATSRFFGRVIVLIPRPYFPDFLLNIPTLEKRFIFLRNIAEFSEGDDDIEIIYSKYFTLPINFMREWNFFFAARSSIGALHARTRRNLEDFDIIHANRIDFGFVGANLKDTYSKPLVITSHGSDVYEFPFRSLRNMTIAKYTLSRANHVIAVSQSDAEKLITLGLPSKKLSVIPNGFNDNQFKPISSYKARESLGLPLDKKIVLSVGTLWEVKGHKYLLEAMRIVSKKRGDVIGIIVGSGPLNRQLQENINALGLKQKVLLVGGKKHSEIPLWMNSCDVFVLPSLNEGFPTVIPEAMACGKPVIGTHVGGIPDIISSDEVGGLVEPKDCKALAKAILDALSRQWSSETILSHVKEYALSNIAKRVVSIYRKVLEQPD